MWYLFFFFCLTSLSMIISSCIHVAASGIFVLFYGWVIFHCIYVPHLYSSVNRHLGYFYVLAVVNSDAMNIGLHVTFWIRVLSSYIPRSRISGSSIQLLSHVWLFVMTWTAAHQSSLAITKSWSLLKLMSIEAMMPSNRLILCHPLLLPLSVFPSIRVSLFLFFLI